MTVEVRPYRKADELAVVSLWQRVFPHAPRWNIPHEDILRKLSVQRELFLVAMMGSALVGTVMAGYDGHRGWVYYLAVDPQYRRQGVGRALMQWVERGLSELGCPKLNLQIRGDNTQAMVFYRRLGYEVEDRVSMGKLLRGADG